MIILFVYMYTVLNCLYNHQYVGLRIILIGIVVQNLKLMMDPYIWIFSFTNLSVNKISIVFDFEVTLIFICHVRWRRLLVDRTCPNPSLPNTALQGQLQHLLSLVLEFFSTTASLSGIESVKLPWKLKWHEDECCFIFYYIHY